MAIRDKLMERDACPECHEYRLNWNLAVRLADNTGAVDGRLRMHDVVPMLVLGCDKCSATVRTVEDKRGIGDVIHAGWERGYEYGYEEAGG